MSTIAPVIALDHPAAFDAARVGRKAASLARARAAGLPVGAGVVLTTQWIREDRATLDQVWRIMSHDGARSLVVRPSAVGADRRRVMTGAVEPVHQVASAAELVIAVDAIRHGAGRTEDNLPVLVQPHVAGAWQGTLFGDAGVAHRRRAIVVAADGDPDLAWIAELDGAGRVREVLSGGDLDHPRSDVLGRLSRLADRVAITFGGPHDIEWVSDEAGHLHLLRVRPLVRLRPVAAGRQATPAFAVHDEESAA